MLKKLTSRLISLPLLVDKLLVAKKMLLLQWN